MEKEVLKEDRRKNLTIRKMDKELKKFITDVRKTFSDAKIMLFGSRAKGTNRIDSDYDLIIISKLFEKIPIVERPYNVWMTSKANLAADILCYSPAEVKKVAKNSTVLRDAMTYAVTL